MTVIYMRTVPGKPTHRALTAPLHLKNMDGSDGYVPFDFEWDGSSSEIISENGSKIKRGLLRVISEPLNFCMRSVFPRHRHPIASCRHDWRCRNAKTKEDRAFADKEFEKDVGKTSWWVTKKAGYLGVRIGSFLGLGW